MINIDNSIKKQNLFSAIPPNLPSYTLEYNFVYARSDVGGGQARIAIDENVDDPNVLIVEDSWISLIDE